MKINSEQEMLNFGEDFARQLPHSAVIELIGDVGAGKTTFTRGLARGLNVAENVTSPSFMISKQYAFRRPDGNAGTLVHYDFYRLPDPGIMQDDLAELIKEPNTIIVVEWANSVADILPERRYKIEILYNDDGSREVKL